MKEYRTYGFIYNAKKNKGKYLPLVVRVTVDKTGATLSIADEEDGGTQYTVDIDQILLDIRREGRL